MSVLSHGEVTIFFLSLGILLATSRIFGEMARRIYQPSVLGELLAGILLGPTVLGYFFPDLVNYLFPTQGPNALALNTITTLAVALFLLVAGLEVDLLTIWRQGRAAIIIGVCGIVFPFAIGFVTAHNMPQWLHVHSEVDPTLFSLFFATALSISALPVIAKTLMDLNLYRSDIGMIVIAAAIFNDLAGWIIFAVILSFMGEGHQAPFPVGYTIATVILFTVFMLTGGKWLINRSLPWIQAHTTWPGGVMSFAISIALLGAAFTEWIGIHAIFGSFLAGVAIGESIHLRERTRSTILQFVSFVFAPLFFASIGLKMNFAAHFDPWLTSLVLVIACIGKVVGCGLGAYLCGVPTREAWSIGFGLNARGAMEIIIGTLALQYGLIGEEMFVALVIMALVTSMMSGPFIQWILRPKRPVRFMQFLNAKTFVHNLEAIDRRSAIEALGQGLSHATGIDKALISEKVLNREEMMSTGIGHGVAVPHARLENLNTPYVGVGISPRGIDFDSPDGEPAHVICMILTPRKDNGAQVEILADIARTFKDDPTLLEKVLEVSTYTEFLAILNIKHTEGRLV